MSTLSPTPLTIDSAVSRAQRIIKAGKQLQESAEQLARSQRENKPNNIIEAAETMRDDALLSYRIVSIPKDLLPVLELLLAQIATK